jgi:hypothetical protein
MIQKIYSSIAVIILTCASAQAQNGCTDPYATNYNSSATNNDGSCIYATTIYSPPLKCTLPNAAVESSGMEWTDGGMWTHNDSGNPNFIMKIDTATGAILKTVYIDNFPNVDWEDISADNDFIYIAETGNNKGTRKDLKVLKIAKKDITSADTVHLNAVAINLSYSDQKSFISSSKHNFDCESIVAIDDSIYLFTKDRGDFRTRVYRVSKTPGTYVLDSLSGYNVNGLICGADYNPTSKEIVLVGYNGTGKSFLWFLNNFKNHDFFSGNKRRIELDYAKDWQTEGITYINDKHLFMSSEAVSGYPASVFTIDKTWGYATSVIEEKKSGYYQVYPNPVSNFLEINNNETTTVFYRVSNTMGQAMASGTLVKGNNTLKMEHLSTGLYFVHLHTEDGLEHTTRIWKL